MLPYEQKSGVSSVLDRVRLLSKRLPFPLTFLTIQIGTESTTIGEATCFLFGPQWVYFDRRKRRRQRSQSGGPVPAYPCHGAPCAGRNIALG